MPGFDRLASLFPGEGAVTDFVKEIFTKVASIPSALRSFATAIVGDETALKTIVDGAAALATLTQVAGAVAVNLGASRNFKLLLDDDATLSAPTNAVEGQTGTIAITQDTGAPFTLAYNAFWVFADGNTPPALSEGEGAIDVLSYLVLPGGTKARVQLSKEEA